VLGVEVADEQEGQPRVVRQAVEQVGIGLEAPGRCADADDKEWQTLGLVDRVGRARFGCRRRHGLGVDLVQEAGETVIVVVDSRQILAQIPATVKPFHPVEPPPPRFAARAEAAHQTASAEWSATAGHSKTPANPSPAPAWASTTATAALYQSIPTSKPNGVARRVSQHAAPTAESAAASIRASTRPTAESIAVPSSNPAATEGATAIATPVENSSTAVMVISVFMGVSM
jgi:hypothetical protein